MNINLSFSELNFKQWVIKFTDLDFLNLVQQHSKGILPQSSLNSIKKNGVLLHSDGLNRTFLFNDTLISIMGEREVVSPEIALRFIAQDKQKKIFDKIQKLPCKQC